MLGDGGLTREGGLSGQWYCGRCHAVHDRGPCPVSQAEAKRRANLQRDPVVKRMYGRRWQAVSAGWLRSHPLCVECERAGIVEAATDVDHVRPHRGDPKIFWDGTNWQSLCRRCHARKTAKGE